MEHIHVFVFIPGFGLEYEFDIPVKVRLADLVKTMLDDMSANNVVDSERFVICDRDTGSVLDPEYSAEEMQLKNGVRLMIC